MNAIRILQRHFPTRVTVYHLISNTCDLNTGALAKVYQSKKVKCLMLPEIMQATSEGQGQFPDRAVQVHQTNFVFTKTQLRFVIDSNDLILAQGRMYIVYAVDNMFEATAAKTVRIDSTISNDQINNEITGSGLNTPVGSLVFQNGSAISLADNTANPCLGIVSAVNGTVVSHVRTLRVQTQVQGIPVSEHRTLWLGTNGLATFERPTTGIIQEVGFATTQISEDIYEVLFDISANTIFA